MGKRLSDEEKTLLARLLEDDGATDADTDEEVEEVSYKGRKYRRVADDEDEPQPVRKPKPKAKEEPDPEPAPRRRRFVT